MEDLSCWIHGPFGSLMTLSPKSESDLPANATILHTSDTALAASSCVLK